jgi:hypothetical protein
MITRIDHSVNTLCHELIREILISQDANPKQNPKTSCPLPLSRRASSPLFRSIHLAPQKPLNDGGNAGASGHYAWPQRHSHGHRHPLGSRRFPRLLL